MQLGENINLVVCQKSKINDWKQHFANYYVNTTVYDLTTKHEFAAFLESHGSVSNHIGIINYDLIFRRPELTNLKIGTLLLDESSLIQNENAKRSKFILKLQTKNVILLSGTPTGGKYERLWSQAKLLGWTISKDLFYKQYIDFTWVDHDGFWVREISGYKNTDRMIRKFKQHGAHFLKTEEVMDLPQQMFIPIYVPTTVDYRKFKKTKLITVDDNELIGDTALTAMLYERQLCGQYNNAKLNAFKDLVESTDDRLIVFYNFNCEMNHMLDLLTDRPVSIINGQSKDLSAYEDSNNAITFVQYQAGAMGLNLQKANKIIYFTPPLSSELYEQSKKRIHRIGQEKSCFYYQLICKNSIEERIYTTLAMRKDYTERLFIDGS